MEFSSSTTKIELLCMTNNVFNIDNKYTNI